MTITYWKGRKAWLGGYWGIKLFVWRGGIELDVGVEVELIDGEDVDVEGEGDEDLIVFWIGSWFAGLESTRWIVKVSATNYIIEN